MKKQKETPEYLKQGAVTYEEMLEEALQNSEFRKEWETRQPARELKSALVAARIKGELTQAEIAERAGTTQSAIARFESGRTNPTLAFMQRLAEALDSKLEVRLVKNT
jgi:DNA-binding XRE family transcriptional regulator